MYSVNFEFYLGVCVFTSQEKMLLTNKYPDLVKSRNKTDHKGTFGTLAIIGGVLETSGSCFLCGHAALKSGCGKVIIGFNQKKIFIPILETVPEIIINKAVDLIKNKKIYHWVVGCGLGININSVMLIKKILMYHKKMKTKLVLDGDALNILAKISILSPLTENCVITPHPKEAARLLNTSVYRIQKYRERSAIALAKKYACWVIIKGNQTVISSPLGKIFVNNSGNVILATSGTGDVLSGVLGSLLAQNFSMQEAIVSAVWLHGQASDILLIKNKGPIGLLAHELINEIKNIRNFLINN